MTSWHNIDLAHPTTHRLLTLLSLGVGERRIVGQHLARREGQDTWVVDGRAPGVSLLAAAEATLANGPATRFSYSWRYRR